jgi:hypothetical protein
MEASRKPMEEAGEASRPLRILRREWKRNKPVCNPYYWKSVYTNHTTSNAQHLPKSTSLPILQLPPKDRPIFTCCQCGFMNTMVPMCLWCCWTSEAAHREFEWSMPRIRRASAPPRFFWQQRDHLTHKWMTVTSMSATNSNNGRDKTSIKEAEIIPDELSAQGERWLGRRTSNSNPGMDSDPPPQHHDVRYETPSETVADVQHKVSTATYLVCRSFK